MSEEKRELKSARAPLTEAAPDSKAKFSALLGAKAPAKAKAYDACSVFAGVLWLFLLRLLFCILLYLCVSLARSAAFCALA